MTALQPEQLAAASHVPLTRANPAASVAAQRLKAGAFQISVSLMSVSAWRAMSAWSMPAMNSR